MLIPYNELSKEHKAACLLAGWIALDPNNGDYLRRGTAPNNGKAGMYIHLYAQKMALVIWANSDPAAIRKANGV